MVKIRIGKNLTQQAYELIRAQILKGELNGRQRLTEGHFAQLFGISKSPIREAVNRLEAEGLITILPRKGAFVRGFTIQDVEEIYELRAILEASVVMVDHIAAVRDRLVEYMRSSQFQPAKESLPAKRRASAGSA